MGKACLLTCSSDILQPIRHVVYAVVASVSVGTVASAGITQVSYPSTQAKQGDLIQLQIESDPEDPSEYRWIGQGKVICSEKACSMDTKDWGPGKHQILAQVFGEMGVTLISFEIELAQHTFLGRGKPIIPRMIPYDGKGQWVARTDPYVRVTHGVGYATRDASPQVLTPVARRLLWDEKLKCGVDSIIKFGIRDREEVYLMARGNVRLEKKLGLRFVHLENGLIRYRSKGADPDVLILVGGWMQIEPAKGADLIIERRKIRGKEFVRVTTLRGGGALAYRADVRGPVPTDFISEVETLQGHSIHVDKYGFINLLPGAYFELPRLNQAVPRQRPMKARVVEEVMRRTTPFYLDPMEVLSLEAQEADLSAEEYEDDYLKESSGERERPKKKNVVRKDLYLDLPFRVTGQQQTIVDEAIQMADRAITDRDYILAMEILSPYFARALQMKELALLWGHAFSGLQNYPKAMEFYDYASRLDPNDASIHYFKSQVALKTGRLEASKNFIRLADRNMESKRQYVLYQRGLLSLLEGGYRNARSYMSQSLWEEEDPVVSELAGRYMGWIESNRTILADLDLAGVYDNNPLHIGDGVSPKTFLLQGKTSYGFLGRGSLRWRLLNLPLQKINLGARGDASFWMTPGVNVTNRFSFDLFLNLDVSLGENDASKWLDVMFEPYFGSLSVGNTSLQGLGTRFGLGFPNASWKPSLLVNNILYFDPAPDTSAYVDPFMGDIEPAALERSARLMEYDLSLELIHQDERTTDIGLGIEMVRYRQVEAKLDDYNLIEASGRYMEHYGKRLWLGLEGSIGSRSFAQASDGRADSIIFLKPLCRYWIFPLMSGDFWLQIQNQSSSRKSANFQSQQIGVRFKVEF